MTEQEFDQLNQNRRNEFFKNVPIGSLVRYSAPMHWKNGNIEVGPGGYLNFVGTYLYRVNNTEKSSVCISSYHGPFECDPSNLNLEIIPV